MFVDRLEHLCKKNNITMAKALLDCGLSTDAASNWRKRGTTPSGDVLVKIAEYFNVTVDYLLEHNTSNGQVAGELDELFINEIADLTDEELEDVKKYIEFLKSKR